MALFRAADFAPVRSGSWAFNSDHPDVTVSGWYWDQYLFTTHSIDPVTGDYIYQIACHNYDGAAYDTSNVVAKFYVADDTAILYGPGKTQDPVLSQTISLDYHEYYPGSGTYYHTGTFTVSATPGTTYIMYAVIEADGEPVLSWGGVLWTGDEYVVIDTPLVIDPAPPPGMTCMLAVANAAAHIEDPDSLGLAVGDTVTSIAQSATWVDWGDGHIQSAGWGYYGFFGFFSTSDTIGFHAYATPGRYTIRIYIGWHGGIGFTAFHLNETVLPTLLHEFVFTATMPPMPTFSQPRTKYTLDIVDVSRKNPYVDKSHGLPYETFGDDYMLVSCPFTAMRTGVTPDVHQTLPASATFHKPYARMYTGYRYSGAAASAIMGVDSDVVMRRDLGDLNSPRPPVTEYGAPNYEGFDYGYYTHGDGPNPTKWRIPAGTAMDDLVGSGNYGPYYMVDYMPKTREGAVSTFVYAPSTGFDQQRIQCFDIDTGALTRSFSSPQTPDTERLTSPVSNYNLPEAYCMYGDDEILWMSYTGALWRHNHDTGVSRLIGNPFDQVFISPDNREVFGIGDSPYGLGTASDGYSARIVNVRNDGSITIIINSRLLSYVPDPTNSYDITYGGYAWWAFSIDRGGRIIGTPQRISTSRYHDDLPWTGLGNHWDSYANTDEHIVVADPSAPIVYVPAEGRNNLFFNDNVYQSAVLAVNLVTGARWIAIWFGHPYAEWNWNATTWTPVAPAVDYQSENYDIRYLEPGFAAVATNIPNGTYKLRPPPGEVAVLVPGEAVFRCSEDRTSYWIVHDDTLDYVSPGGTSSFPLTATVAPGDQIRVYLNETLINVYINASKVASIRDSRNMTETRHGVAASSLSIRMDDFALRATLSPLEATLHDKDVKFAPNA